MATAEDTAYIDHPLLESGVVERRQYQLELAAVATDHHTLVCLPTGLGKTTVSLLVTARRLTAVGGTAVMLAPTKPLVHQHAEFYREALAVPEEEIVVLTGDVSPADRAERFASARVVLATPEVIENDLVGSRIDLADVTHVTFDECHRASGKYAYVYIAERYHEDAMEPLVTGMSASPGGDEEAIRAVCETLGLEEVAVKTEEDADVEAYTHETSLEWERVELPEDVLEIRDNLTEVIRERLETLEELGVAESTDPNQSQRDLNRMRGKLQGLIDAGNPAGYQGMSAHAEIMKLRQAVTLVETQSVEAVVRYFERQRNQARSSGASKASQRLVSDPRVRRAMWAAEQFDDLHPKYRRARVVLAEALGVDGGERAIVFTESRDTAEVLTEFLSSSFEARRFVGQSDREGSSGMTQREQQETLEAFKAGEFEVLVSTSVAEEGLDVPEVDLVLFYEPVPTAIRSIQRKGRTGRQSTGRVVVLMAEDTRDEAYFWISRRREDEMEEELRQLKTVAPELSAELAGSSSRNEGVDGQRGLGEFSSDGGGDGDEKGESSGGVVAAPGEDDTVEVVVDQREMDASIAKDLSRRAEYTVRLETLSVGDYVCSDRVVVERKSVADFVDSLVEGDRSVFEQVGSMAKHYGRPVVVVEGEGIYEQRDVHPNAIRGALSSLAVDFGASVLRTLDEDDTTELLATIARREQSDGGREVSVHGEKEAKTVAEQQEYVVSSIADIGPVTARSLLETFGSVEAVMTASEEELLSAEGVGQVTAERIREVVAGEYTGG